MAALVAVALATKGDGDGVRSEDRLPEAEVVALYESRVEGHFQDVHLRLVRGAELHGLSSLRTPDHRVDDPGLMAHPGHGLPYAIRVYGLSAVIDVGSYEDYMLSVRDQEIRDRERFIGTPATERASIQNHTYRHEPRWWFRPDGGVSFQAAHRGGECSNVQACAGPQSAEPVYAMVQQTVDAFKGCLEDAIRQVVQAFKPVIDAFNVATEEIQTQRSSQGLRNLRAAVERRNGQRQWWLR